MSYSFLSAGRRLLFNVSKGKITPRACLACRDFQLIDSKGSVCVEDQDVHGATKTVVKLRIPAV